MAKNVKRYLKEQAKDERNPPIRGAALHFALSIRYDTLRYGIAFTLDVESEKGRVL